MVLTTGAFLLWAAPAPARDLGAPPTTFPPPPPPAAEILRVAPLMPPTGDDVRVNALPEQALAEVIIDVNPVNPANLVICGYSRSLKTMSTFHSFDAGNTWTHVAVGDAHDGLGADVDRFDPTLVFDADGRVYVGYGARVPVPGGTSDHIVVCRSDDGGITFNPGVFVWIAPDVLGTAGNDKFHLAAGPERFNREQQVIMMAWTWNVPPAFGRVDQQIAVSRSTDAGATFSAPVVINDDSISDRGYSLFADPAIGPNGVMYVAWNDINVNEIRVDHSFDNGNTWGVDVVVETGALPFRTRVPPQPNRGIFAGPVLDADCSGGVYDGRVYLVYCHGSDEDTDVLVRYSDDHANTFSPAVRANDDAPGSFQFLPWLDVNQTNGRVNVIFYDTREDSINHLARVNLAASDDGGESFLINAPVADVPSNNGTSNPRRYPGNYLEYIGVTGWGEDAFVAWTDTRNSPEPLTDYYFDRVPPDPTPPAITVTLDPDELWPPNHTWVEVSATVTLSDEQDPAPAFVLESITSNEPGGGEDVKDAAWGTPDVVFKLRAERNGKGRERVYAVVYRATDATGNVSRGTAYAVVPHDQGGDPGQGGEPPRVSAIQAIEPNPANPALSVRFTVAEAGRVRLSVWDVHGRPVAVLADAVHPAGSHVIRWNGNGMHGSPVASGVYFLVMDAGPVRETRKLVILR